MIITLTNGTQMESRGTKLHFEKIGKRWFMVWFDRTNKARTLTAVRNIKGVKGGRMRNKQV